MCVCDVFLTSQHLYANLTFACAVWISQKQLQQKWKQTGNLLANKGYRCWRFSDAHFVKDPNENATVARINVFASCGYFQLCTLCN